MAATISTMTQAPTPLTDQERAACATYAATVEACSTWIATAPPESRAFYLDRLACWAGWSPEMSRLPGGPRRLALVLHATEKLIAGAWGVVEPERLEPYRQAALRLSAGHGLRHLRSLA